MNSSSAKSQSGAPSHLRLDGAVIVHRMDSLALTTLMNDAEIGLDNLNPGSVSELLAVHLTADVIRFLSGINKKTSYN